MKFPLSFPKKSDLVIPDPNRAIETPVGQPLTRKKLESMLPDLPNSGQYLFFAPGFGMQEAPYQLEFNYSSKDVNVSFLKPWENPRVIHRSSGISVPDIGVMEGLLMNTDIAYMEISRFYQSLKTGHDPYLTIRDRNMIGFDERLPYVVENHLGPNLNMTVNGIVVGREAKLDKNPSLIVVSNPGENKALPIVFVDTYAMNQKAE